MILACQNELRPRDKPPPFQGPVKVALLEGRGRGLVTTRRITAGETLLVSHAFATGDLRTLIPNAARRLKEASARERDQFFSLYDGQNGGQLPPEDLFTEAPPPPDYKARTVQVEPLRFKRIIELNSHDLSDVHEQAGGEGDFMGLWILPAFMNHSCAPTSLTVHVGTEVMHFRASRDLEAGEEVTDSYTNLFCPRAQRHECLMSQKGFRCTCRRCEMEGELDEGAAQRLFARIPEEVKNPERDASALRPLVGEILDFLGTGPLGLGHASFLPAFIHLAHALDQRQEAEEAAGVYRQALAILREVMPGSAYHSEFAIKQARSAYHSEFSLRAAAAHAWNAGAEGAICEPSLARALRDLGDAHRLRFGRGRLEALCEGRLAPPLLAAAAGLPFALSDRDGLVEVVLYLPGGCRGADAEVLVAPDGSGARARCSYQDGAKLESEMSFPRCLVESGPARYRRREHAITMVFADKPA